MIDDIRLTHIVAALLLSNYGVLCSAYKYSIYGSQRHPEKNIFEWSTSEGMNHRPHAVSIAQATANFFVNEGEAYVLSYLYELCCVLFMLNL